MLFHSNRQRDEEEEEIFNDLQEDREHRQMLLEEAHKLEIESQSSGHSHYRQDYMPQTYYVMQEIPSLFQQP